MLMIENQIIRDPVDIRKAFLTYYSDLLCYRMENRAWLKMPIIHNGPTLSSDLWPLLDLSFSAAEIKEAI